MPVYRISKEFVIFSSILNEEEQKMKMEDEDENEQPSRKKKDRRM